MAIKANVRIENEGAVLSYQGATLHIVYDVRRNASREWHVAYAVTRRLERPTTADNRTLIIEWRSLPENLARFKAYAEKQPTTPTNIVLDEWLRLPEINSELQAWINNVRANRLEQYYEEIPQLAAYFDTTDPENLTAQAYKHLAGRHEIIDPVEV